ncbi:LacI family DNA-binding transcriptional regulator [Aquibacillus albus]|uniref:LacI family transcriptional regulator n=1 Tax=Aquibacillus albus TaxID=1168171 RepID=A0ABS2N2G4_9BACI|nr:LacI family DNA-binding transcriptional regulator [Aquibacillus albus]MBM7572297.1 LacI family transcriptional regulator [Aquibacillus albus]
MGVTIKDIAKHAGVSYSTVSKALRDSPLVKEPTKKKILAIAEEIGYQPNVAARSLVSKKSNTIGVIWPTIERVAHSALITRINQYLEDQGYTTLVSINRINTAVTTFNRFQVDAILLFEDTHSDYRFSSSVPVVSYGIASNQPEVPTIDANRREAMKEAVAYLHKLGHKEIIYIGEISEQDPLQADKIKGFKQGLMENNIPFSDEMLIPVPELEQYDGYIATKAMLDKEKKPSAIISSSYDCTKGILLAIKEYNLSIPGDISIISYDNVPQVEKLEYSITTVGVPLDTIAKEVTNILLDTIEGKQMDQSILLQPEINVAKSCRNLYS